jgi:hypothetical protein
MLVYALYLKHGDVCRTTYGSAIHDEEHLDVPTGLGLRADTGSPSSRIEANDKIGQCVVDISMMLKINILTRYQDTAHPCEVVNKM